MLNTCALDPDLPRQRRTVGGGIVYSGLCILGALFAVGRLPQVDAALAQLNVQLHAHNDQIVHTLFHAIPFAMVAVTSFWLVYKALGLLNKSGRSA